MIGPEPELVLTVEEAAKLLGIGRNQTYNAVNNGTIPSIKIGKRIIIPKAALAKYMEQIAQVSAPKPIPEREYGHVLYNRISLDLFERLTQAAKKNARTIAGEVRFRLEQSFNEFDRWPS